MNEKRYFKKVSGKFIVCILRTLSIVLLCLFCLAGCDKLFNKDGDDTSQLPDEAVLTHLPCDSAAVLWMQAFGIVEHSGGNVFFHDGIDFGTQPDGQFFSSTDGTVKQVELNTGKGWPGTNYRITIQVAKNVNLDYHFEIGGSAPESQRINSIFVAAGDQVEAGQHIGNLIVVNSDVAHVHWGVYEDGEADTCPLDYFTEDVAQQFEALYDSGIEKRPDNRPDLCEYGNGSDTFQLPDEAVLTHLPCDSVAVLWMQPFGNVDHGGGNVFFHDGIDFGTQPDGQFFSSTDGTITQVELNTGKGWPGTNYRITIQVAKNVFLDYHFEIGGDVPELQRTNSIFVAAGDTVEAGQHIGNLIVVNSDVAHVHWGVYEDGKGETCPLDYFNGDMAQSLEALYDSGIEKRPAYRSDLCE